MGKYENPSSNLQYLYAKLCVAGCVGDRRVTGNSFSETVSRE